MKQTLLLLLISLPFLAFSQIVWDGGAGTTNWQDANNWSTDAVPGAGDLVEIGTDVTITGSAPNDPSQIKITNSATVTLNLNLTIGDGLISEHALQVNSNGSLTIASGNTVTVNPPDTRNGVSIFASANNASFSIASGGTLIVLQAQHGVSNASATSSVSNEGTLTIGNTSGEGIRLVDGSFTNSGTITITDAGSDGIDNDGTFQNHAGSISIEDANTNGILNRTGRSFTNGSVITITNPGLTTDDGISSEGTFTNNASGSITVTKAGDDCIELTGGTFTNHGSIDVTVEDNANANNNGIAVGTSSNAATFTNTSTNFVDIDGGINASGRGIYVFEMGTLNNTGTIEFTNGNDAARLYTRGVVVNDVGGVLDMTDGRVNVNQGTLTNNGLVRSTRGTSGIFNTATATNNGFFNYTANNNFSVGAGTNNDNGIDLNDPAETTIDAGGACNINIAAASYEYFDGMTSVGSTDGSGSITFAMDALSADPVTLTNGLPGVAIVVENVCAAAVLPIELVYFQARPVGKTVLIEWQTALEINNDFMVVQRSKDGRHFEDVGLVEGAGYSNERLNYQVTDRNPLAGTSYYRLMQVDYDGTETFSEVRAVNLPQLDSEADIRVFPNILSVGQEIRIDLGAFSESETIQLSLYNHAGQSLKTWSLYGGNLEVLGLGQLDPGMYILRVEGKSLTQKIVIR